MRNIVEIRTNMFTKIIEEIEIDLNSRDEIPIILQGLQALYRDEESRVKLVTHLETLLPKEVNQNRGRPGMNVWQILVLALIRLSCNCDYDKLSDLANNHKTLREFLGHSVFDKASYSRQTLVDNLSFFTPKLLEKINKEVVISGYRLCSNQSPSACRIDSFVMESNVHYPTDITLIWDGVRTLISLLSKNCKEHSIGGWRESKSLFKKVKKGLRHCQNIRKRSPKTAKSIEAKIIVEKEATEAYYTLAMNIISKAEVSLIHLKQSSCSEKSIKKISFFIDKTQLILSQLIRRVIDGKVIPHNEKIFSLFEEYTEWISKGKAGVSQELGVRVAVVEGDLGFILHWDTMFQKTDDKVAIPLVEHTLKEFPTTKSVSFDKGFYTPHNKVILATMIETVVLPKKGRLSKKDKEESTGVQYRALRRNHSRIESAINALENHGLDRCYDKGKEAFQRYIALAVVARNILQVGRILNQKEKGKSIAT